MHAGGGHDRHQGVAEHVPALHGSLGEPAQAAHRDVTPTRASSMLARRGAR